MDGRERWRPTACFAAHPCRIDAEACTVFGFDRGVVLALCIFVAVMVAGKMHHAKVRHDQRAWRDIDTGKQPVLCESGMRIKGRSVRRMEWGGRCDGPDNGPALGSDLERMGSMRGTRGDTEGQVLRPRQQS